MPGCQEQAIADRGLANATGKSDDSAVRADLYFLVALKPATATGGDVATCLGCSDKSDAPTLVLFH